MGGDERNIPGCSVLWGACVIKIRIFQTDCESQIMTKAEKIFFELIKVAIGKLDGLSCVPTEEEWAQVFEICREQAVVGIGYAGVKTLSDSPLKGEDSDNDHGNGFGMSETLCLNWLGVTAKVQQQNKLVNTALGELCSLLNTNDVAYVVVKGQVLGTFYPDNMSELRTPGDVDFYVTDADYERAKVLIEENLNVKVEGEGEADKHDTFEYKNVRFEMHYRLETFGSSKYQRYFDAVMDDAVRNRYATVDINGVDVRTLPYEENVVMTFKHLFNHLLVEGVGIRQFLDLQMLLRPECEALPLIQPKRLKKMLEGIGYMKAFKATCAMMIEYLGMDEGDCPFRLSTDDFRWADKLVKVPMSRGNFGKHHRKHVTYGWRRSLETAQIAMVHCFTFIPLAWRDIACLIPRRIGISVFG